MDTRFGTPAAANARIVRRLLDSMRSRVDACSPVSAAAGAALIRSRSFFVPLTTSIGSVSPTSLSPLTLPRASSDTCDTVRSGLRDLERWRQVSEHREVASVEGGEYESVYLCGGGDQVVVQRPAALGGYA